MEKFLLSSPALLQMELDTSMQRSLQQSLYDGPGLGVGFLPSERQPTKSPDHSPPALSAFSHLRNLSFVGLGYPALYFPTQAPARASHSKQPSQDFSIHELLISVPQRMPPPSQPQPPLQLQQQVSQQYQQLSSQLQMQPHTLQRQMSLSQLKPKVVRHLSSVNTMSSLDSMPQLSSSVSNHLLAEDSPATMMYNQVTPRRTRKKSYSVSSANSINTPMRGWSAPFSPAAAAPAAPASAAAAAKVSKTPHSARGHSRSRSRVLLDAVNSPFASGSGVNLGAHTNYNTHHASHGGANPFYTPSSFGSPRLDELLGDLENLEDTPLATPNGSFVHLPAQQSFLSPGNAAANFWHATQGAQPAYDAYNLADGYVTPLALQRNETLDSIKIEDQDDDAMKEIRKAKQQLLLRQKVADSSGAAAAALTTPSEMKELAGGDVFDNALFYNELDLVFKFGGHEGQSLPLQRAQSTPAYRSPSAGYSLLRPQQKPQPLYNGDALYGDASPYLESSGAYRAESNAADGAAAGNGTAPHAAQVAPSPASFSSVSLAATLLPPMATFSTSKVLPQATEDAKHHEAKTETPIDPKKKHPCPLCDSRFQRPEHVKRHMKSHSKEKPFQCDVENCGKRFNRKDNLKAHLKKIHQRT